VPLVEDFHVALAALAAEFPGSELLPERLARACAQVLPVDGAGISLFFASDRRLPLGASDAASAEAERLQFTAGEGPCLTSHATGDVVLADAATLRARWPGYNDALVARTPIRGSLSLPLRDELRGIGALDLYVVSPREVASLRVDDALAVAAQVAAVLPVPSRQDRVLSSGGPAWLDAPGRRAAVHGVAGDRLRELGPRRPEPRRPGSAPRSRVRGRAVPRRPRRAGAQPAGAGRGAGAGLGQLQLAGVQPDGPPARA
jgi:hypothetical protein